MEKIILFQNRNKSGLLYSLNPISKLFCLIAFSILISNTTPLVIFISFFFLILILLLINYPIKGAIKSGYFFIIMALFIYITDSINRVDHTIRAANTLQFLSILIASLIFTDTTSPNQVARSISALLYPIFRERANRFGFIIELTLSMIPTLFITISTILDARRSRCERFFTHPIKTITSLSVSIFSQVFLSISEYVDALESRLYNDKIRRKALKYTIYDLLVFLFSFFLLGVMVWTKRA